MIKFKSSTTVCFTYTALQGNLIQIESKAEKKSAEERINSYVSK